MPVGSQNTVIKCGGAYNKVSARITGGREMTNHFGAGELMCYIRKTYKGNVYS